MMDKIRKEGRLLFESIRGSHLFGTNTETSDIDTYGVFIGPSKWFLGLGFEEQLCVKSEKNDDSWNELKKYCNELSRSNPDALSSLFTPEKHIIYFNPILQPIWDIKDEFLTKECFKPFSSYALSQIKKAKGLKKAININPETVKEKKSLLDFCYVPRNCGIITLTEFLKQQNLDPSKCGIVRLPKGIETYALYYNEDIPYRGIVLPGSSQLRVSDIPKDQVGKVICHFQYNSNAYTEHCNDFKRYWDWVKNRNEDRFQLNKGYDFDSKNMSHCVRLITMAKEIAEGKGMQLDRTNIDRDLLLDVKNHNIKYEDLMKYVNNLEKEMLKSFETSKIPETTNIEKINKLMIDIRFEFYNFPKP